MFSPPKLRLETERRAPLAHSGAQRRVPVQSM